MRCSSRCFLSQMEFTRQKAGMSEIAKLHKEQLNDLHNRLKEAQTTVSYDLGPFLRSYMSASYKCKVTLVKFYS